MARKLYLDINARPRQILQVMDQAEEEVKRYRTEQKYLWRVIGGALGVAALFFLIDKLMGYLDAGFAPLSCLFGLGALGLFIFALFRTGTRLPQEQFEAARKVLYTLRDDVGHKGRVMGWLDLTGPQQKSKLLRTSRSVTGNTKYYYSDPWLSTKIQLVDGNLLRLTLADKIKVKKGFVVQRSHQIKVKLVVNPQVYEIGPGKSLPAMTQDGTILQVKGDKPEPLNAEEVLNILKVMYTHLHPKTTSALNTPA